MGFDRYFCPHEDWSTIERFTEADPASQIKDALAQSMK